MIGDLGVLGLFELKELSFGKKITMPLRASKDGDATRNWIMSDESEAGLTNRATWLGWRLYHSCGGDGVNVAGFTDGNIIGEPTRKPVATTVETLMNLSDLIGFGMDFRWTKRGGTVGAGHDFSLAGF